MKFYIHRQKKILLKTVPFFTLFLWAAIPQSSVFFLHAQEGIELSLWLLIVLFCLEKIYSLSINKEFSQFPDLNFSKGSIHPFITALGFFSCSFLTISLYLNQEGSFGLKENHPPDLRCFEAKFIALSLGLHLLFAHLFKLSRHPSSALCYAYWSKFIPFRFFSLIVSYGTSHGLFFLLLIPYFYLLLNHTSQPLKEGDLVVFVMYNFFCTIFFNQIQHYLRKFFINKGHYLFLFGLALHGLFIATLYADLWPKIFSIGDYIQLLSSALPVGSLLSYSAQERLETFFWGALIFWSYFWSGYGLHLEKESLFSFKYCFVWVVSCLLAQFVFLKIYPFIIPFIPIFLFIFSLFFFVRSPYLLHQMLAPWQKDFKMSSSKRWLTSMILSPLSLWICSAVLGSDFSFLLVECLAVLTIFGLMSMMLLRLFESLLKKIPSADEAKAFFQERLSSSKIENTL